ncbi:hypothetical protein [Marinospirillum sp.]|uniref:hypothetical protein n=1 Tax=Marinospirillum sp. TaxID=2183934 RepID=UPI00384C8035
MSDSDNQDPSEGPNEVSNDEENLIFGTHTERLIGWVKANPAPGLSPQESQMLTLLLLWLLHAPRDLLLLTTVLNNLSSALDAVFNAFEEKDQELLVEDLPISQNAIALISNHLTNSENQLIACDAFDIGAYVQGQDIDADSHRHPLRGRMSDFPIYAALMNASIDEEESFRILQGLVFLAHANLRNNFSNPQDYLINNPGTYKIKDIHSCVQQAGLFVRQFSVGDVDDDSQEVFDEPSSLTDLYQTITEREQDRQGEERERYKAGLSALFKKWLENYFVQLNSGSGGGKKRRKYRRKSSGWHDGFVRFGSGLIQENLKQDPEEAYGPSSNGRYLSDIQLLSEQATVDDDQEHLITEQRQADLDIAENAVGGDLFIAEEPSTRSAGRLIIGNQIAHIIRANQLLSTNWAQATTWEIAELLKMCEGIIYDQDEYRSNQQRRETATIILLMLWTGSTLDKAVTGLRWVKGTLPNPVPISYLFKGNSGDSCIRIKLTNASAKIKPNKKQLEYLHPREEFLNLPDPVGLGAAMRRAFVAQIDEIGSYKLYTHKTPTYRASLNSLLRLLPSGHRLNEHKISMFLFHKIATETSGDVADAILTTSRYHPLGQTLLHYSSPEQKRQTELYVKTVKKIISELSMEGYDLRLPCSEGARQDTASLPRPERHDPVETSSAADEHAPATIVGSHFFPQKKCIQNLISTLKTQIKRAPDPSDLDQVMSYHNCFTLYSNLMLGYATGYRAVKDPVLAEDDIDPETGLAVISDKDGPELYNARLVWIPDSVQKQLAHYQTHYSRLLPILQHLDQEAYNFNSLQNIPKLFLLDNNLRWEPIRPKTLKPLLESTFPLPININRRFLRTTLRARGCPAEVVDGFMGHWGRGQEPWGEHSTLSTHDYLETLKPHITAIQQELGFEVCASQYHK